MTTLVPKPRNPFKWFPFVAVILLLLNSTSNAEEDIRLTPGNSGETAVAMPPSVTKVLSWLPTDTETVLVAQDFSITSQLQLETWDPDFVEMFQRLGIGSLSLYCSTGLDPFMGRKVSLAVHGARKFREPKGFGGSLYEGCHLIIFDGMTANEKESLLSGFAAGASETLQIHGEQVLKYSKVLEDDEWLFWLAWPNEDTFVISTDLGYLSEVLNRIMRGGKDRALADSLIEWKYVDRSAPAWGIHHFNRLGFEDDPTSPFKKHSDGEVFDSEAVGFVINVGRNNSSSAESYYLSKDPAGIEKRVSALKDPLAHTEFTHEIFKEGELTVLKMNHSRNEDGEIPDIVIILWLLGHGTFL